MTVSGFVDSVVRDFYSQPALKLLLNKKERSEVKHSRSLIQLLNKHIVPTYANRLILTHENSDLFQLDLTNQIGDGP